MHARVVHQEIVLVRENSQTLERQKIQNSLGYLRDLQRLEVALLMAGCEKPEKRKNEDKQVREVLERTEIPRGDVQFVSAEDSARGEAEVSNVGFGANLKAHRTPRPVRLLKLSGRDFRRLFLSESDLRPWRLPKFAGSAVRRLSDRILLGSLSHVNEQKGKGKSSQLTERRHRRDLIG